MTFFLAGALHSVHLQYRVTTLLHEPLGRAGGSADADGVDLLEPRRVYLVGAFYLVRITIDAPTLVEKHLPVRALAPADEENEVVASRKVADARHAVGH